MAATPPPDGPHASMMRGTGSGAGSGRAGSGSGFGGAPAAHTRSQRPTGSNWGASGVPNRPSNAPGGSRRSYRQSNMRRSTSSRAGDGAVDPYAPIKVVDEQGVNRTPKPLVAIVTSAALRQARGLAAQESLLGSEASEAAFGDLLSSNAFSRTWFDSGALTPAQEASAADLDLQQAAAAAAGRLLVPSNAALSGGGGGDQTPGRLLRGSAGGGGSSKSLSGSRASSQRATRTPPGTEATAAAAAAAALSEDDLAARHTVLLAESEDIVPWHAPGIAVAADTPEGAAVAAANARYAAALAGREAADKLATSAAQTPAVVLKHREVQSGGGACAHAACQASAADIHDSCAAALPRPGGDEADEQVGSVLPSGAAVTTGPRAPSQQASSPASFIRTSMQQFRPSSSVPVAPGARGSSTPGGPRMTALDSTWSRPASSRASGMAKTSSFGAARGAAAVVLLASSEPAPEPWTQLPGLADALAVMEAAISQNTYLPQLLLYRDIKLPPPPDSARGASCSGDALSAAPSLTGAGAGLGLVPPTPMGRPSACSTPGRATATGDSWTAHTPGGHAAAAAASAAAAAYRPSATGGALGSSMSGLGPGGLSRRPSSQLPPPDALAGGSRQSSFMSLGSSRIFRGTRPPAGLQLLWTWSCPLTEGAPVSSLTWNAANSGLLAAGYGSQAAPAAGGGEAAAAATNAPGTRDASLAGGPAAAAGDAGAGSRDGGAGLGPAAEAAPGAAGGPAGAGAGAAGAAPAADAGASGGAAAVSGGGRVALWSLKNLFHPIWSFSTKSAVTALDFSVRSPHILAVGMHDGTIAAFDVRCRSAAPLLASTAETGRHAGPVWKLRWVDQGPEREEQLVSVSTDGQLKAWTIAKGLEVTTLMTLKRVPHRLFSAGAAGARGAAPLAGAAPPGACAAGAGAALPAGSGAKAAATVAALRSDTGAHRDAFISRNTGGMAFDFNSLDRRIYLAGTEDGHIHKCSTSYAEQYLETYQGHIGPVYALAWSPFSPSLFLSCSGDWTIRLWQEGRPTQLLSFQSSNREVLDVAWCPSNSTVFGAATADGRLELWDIAVSTLRPVVQHAATRCAMTALLFAKDAPVVVAATDAGGLLVFRLHNIAADRLEAPEMQLTRLEEALRSNVMKAALAAG